MLLMIFTFSQNSTIFVLLPPFRLFAKVILLIEVKRKLSASIESNAK